MEKRNNKKNKKMIAFFKKKNILKNIEPPLFLILTRGENI